MSKNNKEGMDLKWFIPLAAFVLFMLPILNTAFQIELARVQTISIVWVMVISAAIGAGLSTTAKYIEKIFEKHRKELEETVATLENKVTNLGLNHKLTEREIMINALLLNERWNKQNIEINNLADLARRLKVDEDEPEPNPVNEPYIGVKENIQVSPMGDTNYQKNIE